MISFHLFYFYAPYWNKFQYSSVALIFFPANFNISAIEIRNVPRMFHRLKKYFRTLFQIW